MKQFFVILANVSALVAAALLLPGCPACTPGIQVSCDCPSGRLGAQTCAPNGSGYNACVCPGDDAGTGADADAICVPNCTGRMCGHDGCGGACGNCPSGQTCNDATGVCGCVPNCAGLACGPDPVCGTSCGTCGTGLGCTSAGRCVPACLPIDSPCTTGDTCCPDPNGGSLAASTCVFMPGLGRVCRSICSRNAECRSNCCVQAGSNHVCALSQYCHTTCTRASLQPCTASDVCCDVTSNGPPSSCTPTAGSASYCAPLCITNADCDAATGTSGLWFCATRATDSLLVCMRI